MDNSALISPATGEVVHHEVRGRRVFIDSDVARLLRSTVPDLHQLVAINSLGFPGDFAFPLTVEEEHDLLSWDEQPRWSSDRPRRRTLVFTWLGVAMAANLAVPKQPSALVVALLRSFDLS